MSWREFFAIRGEPKWKPSAPPDLVIPPPFPAYRVPIIRRTEIKRGDYEICLILKTLEAILATLADVQKSLGVLGDKIDAAVVKLGEPPAATAADLDALKSGIDGMAAKVDAALNPPPAV